jgi:hypothetical protein
MIKFFKTIIVIICFVSSSHCGASSLKTGTYQLEGSNDESGNINYHGKVIVKSSGELYELRWIIGRNQMQIGTAILEGDVLSVNYYDLKSHSFGVVSYRIISENILEGKWAGFRCSRYGREFLTFESENTDD